MTAREYGNTSSFLEALWLSSTIDDTCLPLSHSGEECECAPRWVVRQPLQGAAHDTSSVVALAPGKLALCASAVVAHAVGRQVAV